MLSSVLTRNLKDKQKDEKKRKKRVDFFTVLRIRIRRIRSLLGLLDPDPDPLVGGTDPGHGVRSTYNQAKIVRKTLIPTVLRLLYDFLSLKNDVHVASKSNKQKNLENPNPDPLVRGTDPPTRIRTIMLRIRRPRSVPKCYGSATSAHLSQLYLSFSMSWLEMSKEAYASWMRREMVIFSSSLTASMASGSSRITELKYLNQRREKVIQSPSGTVNTR